MRLRSVDGAGEFELTIAGYEFPADVDWESVNWLEVDLRVQTPKGRGTSRVACMQTWDAVSFADWLDALGSSQPQACAIMVFPEPNLQFRVTGQWPDRVALDVIFILERPGSWEMESSSAQGASHYVGNLHLLVQRERLRAAAAALRAELRDFPVRMANI